MSKPYLVSLVLPGLVNDQDTHLVTTVYLVSAATVKQHYQETAKSTVAANQESNITHFHRKVLLGRQSSAAYALSALWS